jgi:hypothetical protein
MSSPVSTATVSPTNMKTAPQKQQKEKASANKQNDDFFWTYTEEPHATRRQAIIKAHPEVHFT